MLAHEMRARPGRRPGPSTPFGLRMGQISPPLALGANGARATCRAHGVRSVISQARSLHFLRRWWGIRYDTAPRRQCEVRKHDLPEGSSADGVASSEMQHGRSGHVAH